MRTERIVWNDGFFHQLRPLRCHARIDVLAVITVRPAVKATLLDRRHIIRNQIAADFVAFVDGNPQRAAIRLPGQAVRVSEA